MNKNLTTITIENYNEKNVIFTMPKSAAIEICRSMMVNGDKAGLITHMIIETACPEGIDVKVEDYINEI